MPKKLKRYGFTLIELLVVMAIIAVLTTLIAGGFRSSQMRSRDAARKSDLKQVANALEIYYNDYGMYPNSPLPWGSEFSGKSLYFKKMPLDPSGLDYYYRVFDSNQKYQLYSHLENSQDKNIDLAIIQKNLNCGEVCNFGISSSNTLPTE